MRLVVALHHHFRKTPDGTVYPYHVFNYEFWKPYLEVFEEVCVFARLSNIARIDQNNGISKASGQGVSFIGLPDFQGLKGFLKAKAVIKQIAAQTIADKQKTAFILRPPSMICDILWSQLLKENVPYGLEVVGDPWDAYSPGSVNTPLRPLIRRVATNRLKKQCHKSSATSYVTEYGLQSRYPAGGWETYFSDIILKADDIISDKLLNCRIQKYTDKVDRSKRFRLCTVGSLWHLAKAQDILISAVAQCIQQGCNLELVLVGDGSFKEQLQKQARMLRVQDRIIFAGHLPPGDPVFTQLDLSDIYILPSRQEGLPRSVIEAMARGLPCITSNVSGLPELVENQWLVKPEDVNELSCKIQSLISSPQEMVRLAKVNLSKAKEYEYSVLLSRRIEMYNKLKDITKSYGS